MGLFNFLKGVSPQVRQEAEAQRVEAERRQADILSRLKAGQVPTSMEERLQAAAAGRVPWMATLTPAELRIVRSHGVKPIAMVCATCWLHYGWSWTLGHSQGWNQALQRLAQEAKACGANAILDVKMRTIPVETGSAMDFSLVGTAVKVDDFPSTGKPVIATVPALEFVKLLEAQIIPSGIAIGAHYEWLTGWRANSAVPANGFNREAHNLSSLWETVRRKAHANLRENVQTVRGTGALAHVNFSQMFEAGPEDQKRYLARHITVATVVNARGNTALPHDIKMVVDMKNGVSPLTGTPAHHQSYDTNEEDGAI